MLRLGLDVDSRNNAGATSLMKAAYSSKEIAFQQLIQNVAHPFLKDNGGYSLLHNAVQCGNASIIDNVLSPCLEIDLGNDHSATPLMTVANRGDQSAFEMLLQRGADAFLKCDHGNCILHFAAQGGNTSITNKLLSRSLEIDSRNNDWCDSTDESNV